MRIPKFVVLLGILSFFLRFSLEASCQTITLNTAPQDNVTYSFSTWDAIVTRTEKTLQDQRGGEAPWVPIPQSIETIPKEQILQKDGSRFKPPLPQPPAPALSMDFDAISTSGLPPDTNGAVGPTHLVVAVNFLVRIQERDGTNVNTVSLLNFFNGFGLFEIFDPKVIYDPLAERFILVACADKRSATSSMMLAVSETSDPTQGWHRFQLLGDEENNDWVDYPNIGITRDWITFTSNMFQISDDAYKGVNLWVIDKNTALNGGPLDSNQARILSVGSTLVPALTFDADVESQYMVTALLPSFGVLGIYKLTGPAENPVFETVAPFPTAEPWGDAGIGAEQLGTSVRINSNDSRIMNAVVRNGKLWTAHHIGVPTENPDHLAVQWYVLNVDEDSGSEGMLLQYGRIDDYTENGLSYLYPTISVNRTNDVMMGFTGVSATTYASAYYTFRAAEALDGVVDTPVLYKAGLGPYTKTRWGDYSATVVDPQDDLSLWTIQEFAKTSSNHGTWWGMISRVDSRLPRLSAVHVENNTHVLAVFDEPMTESTAVSDFSFSGDGVALSANSALVVTSRKVMLEVNEMTNGAMYYLVASGRNDLAGNEVIDESVSFTGLGIAPIVTVDDLETENIMPALTGTVNDFEAAIRVRVGEDQFYQATNAGDGTWHLEEEVLMPLAPGIYNVEVEAEDLAGNIGFDTSIDELKITAFEAQVPVAGRIALFCCALLLVGIAQQRLSQSNQ